MTSSGKLVFVISLWKVYNKIHFCSLRFFFLVINLINHFITVEDAMEWLLARSNSFPLHFPQKLGKSLMEKALDAFAVHQLLIGSLQFIRPCVRTQGQVLIPGPERKIFGSRSWCINRVHPWGSTLVVLGNLTDTGITYPWLQILGFKNRRQ